MSLVPVYQKQMADDQLAKIHFRFFVVEEAEIRSDLACIAGLILLPRQVLERLQNDDQVAALLADGIASNLQSIRLRLIVDGHILTPAEAAEETAMTVDPISIPLYSAAVKLVDISLQEERGRIALSLMADAGYDPWQAPQAWRLIEPKHLPKDLTNLRETRRSEYQLGILGAQYKKTADRKTATPASEIAPCGRVVAYSSVTK